MAELSGLSGWRYNPTHVSDLAGVTVPPYDVISPAEQAAYLAKNPFSFIQLELPQADAELGLDKYQNAARILHKWVEDQVLVHEAMPAIYFYEQTFTVGTERHSRLGFISALRLEPWSAGVILPHERTLAKPKADRLALMEATKSQLSPVFALYEDSGDLAELVRSAAQGQPNVDCTDEAGVQHRVWIRSASSLVNEISATLAHRKVVIADGHHRYETALAYRDQLMAKGPVPNDDPSRFVLMMLVSMADPGLVVLPTHRVVFGLDADRVQTLLPALQDAWHVEAVAPAALPERLKAAAGPGALGVVLPDGAYLATVKDWSLIERAFPEMSDAYKRLDVAILHRCLLEQVLGIDIAAQAAQTNLSYIKNDADALAAVSKGGAQVAFLLQSTPVEALVAVAKAGEVMPQKSTYFYPKLRSGLVFNGLETLK
ncbi:MAG: DUF1015 domain-containing protein [Candidatus Sericytochromatia bacterium]|nr:DUF1015 domain-containing protein [Candidatus Sericytochromatia bacterium]